MTAPAMTWRFMTEADLPAVMAIADMVHPDFPEDEAVFANRLQLDATGCAVLAAGGVIAGYVVSHPWQVMQPPALNVLLTPATMPSTLYIHDLALLPEARKSGAGTILVDMIATRAKAMALPNMTLVAVNNSVHFWQRQGFTIVHDAGLEQKLQSYGDHARFMIRDLS